MSEWTVDTLKEHLCSLIGAEREERKALEHRTEERFTRERTQQEKATADALAAQKEKTSDAFASSEKAIVKAEAAQTAHNVLANGLQGRLDQQAKDFIARPEFDQRLNQLEGKIGELREYRSTDIGKSEGYANVKGVVLFVVALMSFLVGSVLLPLFHK